MIPVIPLPQKPPGAGGVPSVCAFFLLQKVKRVVGIELCQEAVEDARVNARDNGESHCPTQRVGGQALGGSSHPCMSSAQHLEPTRWLLGSTRRAEGAKGSLRT